MPDGRTSTTVEVRADLANQVADFLNFCRIEKGLAINSLEAYARDLLRFSSFCKADSSQNQSDTVLSYLNSLYQSRLGSRSIARHLATLRNFYSFMLREGKIASDPTEHVRTPKQWKTIPKFLNLSQIEKLL